MQSETLLVTGATGMVGRAVVRRAVEAGYRVRALVRNRGNGNLMDALDVEQFEGDLAVPETLPGAVQGVDVVVHAAAHVGDWGPAEKYRAINVVALEHMLTAARREGRLRRWVQISSLGVYSARHHHGTNESEPINVQGLDGYTRTKAEAELLLRHHIRQDNFPAVILRPGFIYGAGDRHVAPRLIERIRKGKMKLIGDGQKLLNNTSVENLVDAILLAVDAPQIDGEIFNIRDQRLVTREEFVGRIADYIGHPRPGKIPEWLARSVVGFIEGWSRLRGATEAPMLTRARIKFLTLNLDFSIDKAKQRLGYAPRIDFEDGIREALESLTGGPAGPSSVAA